ncbi:hemolymph lipopolysaccharide-binding protein-like [Cydia fagiglandana]|uniref:hemolymph lipopolysaccharide-binding protein-like n=1 Tax=Cydia fagiglandana TaxID=1458189 RepID=UPI002FEE16F8
MVLKMLEAGWVDCWTNALSRTLPVLKSPNSPKASLRYKYEPLTGSCYKFHRFAQRWNRAARVCHAEGGHLAIINSKIEAKVLKHIFEKNPVETIVEAKHADVALIGVWKWEDGDGEWSTIFGETLEKAGFAQWSEPLDRHSTYGAIQRSGLLDAVKKYVRDPFICEIKL